LYIVNSLNTRISSFFKNLGKEFYKNYSNDKHYSVDTLQKQDEEGENYLNDIKNISADIETISRKIQTKFIYDTIIDLKLLDIACKNTQISKSKMSVIIDKIRDTDGNLLKDLISTIISYYLSFYKVGISNIKSSAFVNNMLKLYTVSNTSNTFVIKIKSILDDMLNKYSEEYLKTSRKATLSGMRYCLYIYMVLFISTNAD
jgi:hypothetical protein